MKKLLSAVFTFATLLTLADPAITQQSVRQRWPFSPKVDIDLCLESSANADVELQATYDGCATPITLSVDQLEGSLNLHPGFNHLVWDPLAAGLGESKLTGFTVTATLASFDARKFLVLDLINRNWAYYAADPDGQDWSDIKYRRHYMVFRRVPAGTYQVGFTLEQMERLRSLGASQTGRTALDAVFAVRTITISKDYYIGIHLVTDGQRQHIAYYGTLSGKGYYNGGSWCDKVTAASAYTQFWRGNATNAVLACAWPQNGHSVLMPEMTRDETTGLLKGDASSGSVVGRLRALMMTRSHDLPSNMVIDLPTQEQWEIAARAGTTTLLADCGTLTTPTQDILDYQEAHSTEGAGSVGEKLPNSWGLYDTAGLSYECVLNNVNVEDTTQYLYDGVVTADAGQTVDPVGFTCSLDKPIYSVVCNCGWSCHGINYGSFPPNRRIVDPTTGKNNTHGARLCIHLK